MEDWRAREQVNQDGEPREKLKQKQSRDEYQTGEEGEAQLQNRTIQEET